MVTTSSTMSQNKEIEVRSIEFYKSFQAVGNTDKSAANMVAALFEL